MADRVVAVLGRGVVPADTAILRADDLGVLRGDGIFETVHVRDGRPWLFDEHLVRMQGSADRLGLALPAHGALAGLVAEVCAQWPDRQEGALRVVCTRGVEGGSEPTVFATLSPVAAGQLRGRRDGVAVATASLGFAAEARGAAPWLLGGVKSLSYAVNMATLRWAEDAGADDALWVSADGWALEAPTSTLVWLAGDALCTVPSERTGILPGCTARHLLDHAGALGLRATERMIRPAELAGTDGAWLLSSVRGVAPIRSVDGTPLPASRHTAALLDLLGFPG
ncbi:MAG TPA: aminotransferase class IV [Pilimelia sp.]|nr:aminotransferase class IV [Pilimelia sp.]